MYKLELDDRYLIPTDEVAYDLGIPSLAFAYLTAFDLKIVSRRWYLQKHETVCNALRALAAALGPIDLDECAQPRDLNSDMHETKCRDVLRTAALSSRTS